MGAGMPIEGRPAGPAARGLRDRPGRLRMLVSALWLGGLAVGLVAEPSRAAGFFIQEQSAQGIGRAFAGEAALAEDASTVFYNPAGLTRLEGAQIQVESVLLHANLELDDRGSSVDLAVFGDPIGVGADDGRNAIGFLPAGAFYAAAPLPVLEERLWFGLGVSAPFNLTLDYDDAWFGRYDSTDSELLTIDIAPTLAFAVTDWLSVGGGANFQRADVVLENALPNPFEVAQGRVSHESDGELEIEGDDWSVGWNVGILLTPREGTRLGFSYRSAMNHELEGEAEFSDLTGALAVLNGSFDGSADLDLPSVLMAAVAHELTPSLTLLGQFNFVRWQVFDEIRVELEDPAVEDLVRPQNYGNAISVAVGAEWEATQRWTLRSGFQWDESPVDDALRDTRVPDGDRFWAAVGLSYLVSERVQLDLSYAHIFFESVDIDLDTPVFEGTIVETNVNTRAEVDSSADLLALRLHLRF